MVADNHVILDIRLRHFVLLKTNPIRRGIRAWPFSPHFRPARQGDSRGQRARNLPQSVARGNDSANIPRTANPPRRNQLPLEMLRESVLALRRENKRRAE